MGILDGLKRLVSPPAEYKSDLLAPVDGFSAGSALFTPDMQISWRGNRSAVDYAQKAGDLSQNAIIMATIQWKGRTFPEAPIIVTRPTGEGDQRESIPDHPAALLMRRPNPYYSGLLMWPAIIASYNLDGNAYIIKWRDGSRRVQALWWEPHTSIRPHWPKDGSDWIDYYELYRNGGWGTSDATRLDPDDVIHFRYGLDPANPRYGLSPLRSLLREIYTDNEAAAFTAALLANMGVPSLLVSPKETRDGSLSAITDPEGLKQAIMDKTTGARRGEPLVMGRPLEMSKLGFNPAELDLANVRRIPEERLTAALGVPSAIVGFGSGLDRATYSNILTLKALAYESDLIPMHRNFEETLTISLLPDVGNPETERIEFDRSDVAALQEDQTERATRMALLYEKGLIKRSEGRLELNMGLQHDPADDLYRTDPPAIRETVTSVDPTAPALPKSESNGHDTKAEALPDESQVRAG